MKKKIVNGIRLAAVDRGSGPVVLLVHGFPLDHTMWSAQIDALAQRHRVIAPDLRGFGASGVSEGAVRMEQFADDLAGLLDVLGVDEPVVFCGLSMGGYVGWQFHKRHRERLGGLILCDTRAIADTPEAAAGRRLTADRVVEEGPALVLDAMLPKLVAETTAQIHPEVVDSLRRMIHSCDPRGIAAAARGMAERSDFTARLSEIECPTLVIVGELDAISSVDEMRSIAEAIPSATLAVIPDVGHMSPMENPSEVNGVIETFLADLTY